MTTITTANTADERTIRLILEVTREADDSYSLSLEDERFPEDSDERFVSGLTEGAVFDPFLAVQEAESMVGDYLGKSEAEGGSPAISRIALP